MIRAVTGLNEARDGSTPDPNSLVGIQKLAALNSNTATRHILEGSLYLTRTLAECLAIRTADVLEYADFKDEFAMQVGKYNLGILEEIKNKYLPKMVEGKWSGTMCLTEPVCGTDLGLLKTKATEQDDGTFKLSGQKIFITSGDLSLIHI